MQVILHTSNAITIFTDVIIKVRLKYFFQIETQEQKHKNIRYRFPILSK